MGGFRGKLAVLVGLFVVGFAALVAINSVAVETVRIDGRLYNSIVGKKDLLNDLIPPSLYLRGPHVLLSQIMLEPDVGRQRAQIDLYRELEANFKRQCERWRVELNTEPMKSVFRDEVATHGFEFFQVAEREVLPLAGNGPLAQPVQEIVRGRLRQIQEKQEPGVRKLIALAKDASEAAEADAAAAVRFWNSVVWAVSGVVLGLIVLAGWYIARGIVNPATKLIRTMRRMAAGDADLSARVEVTSKDEIGQLSAAINDVIGKIHDLVVKVRESSIQLFASSTEIAATAREQESTMQTLGASTNQIATAVKEISATSTELSRTMNAVYEGGKQAGSLAAAGRDGLTGMGAAMRKLADGTEAISGKLGAVREKANDINLVVTTITKVADQTNLLSINAAIEAEKAGESGRGFLVVAREIRRLADQTAVATLDIENMVRQMQSAVSAGVMEMDKFADEVRTGVGRVAEINGQIGQIIGKVHDLNDQFAAVNESMSQQSGGTSQINDAMLQLAAGVQQTSASLKEFHSVTGSLRDAADALRGQVARFKVAG